MCNASQYNIHITAVEFVLHRRFSSGFFVCFVCATVESQSSSITRQHSNNIYVAHTHIQRERTLCGVRISNTEEPIMVRFAISYAFNPNNLLFYLSRFLSLSHTLSTRSISHSFEQLWCGWWHIQCNLFVVFLFTISFVLYELCWLVIYCVRIKLN